MGEIAWEGWRLPLDGVYFCGVDALSGSHVLSYPLEDMPLHRGSAR